MNLIHIPRTMVQAIIDNDKKTDFSRARTLDICVKIPYRGYEISVATDARSDRDDFLADSLRVYDGNDDVTKDFVGILDRLPTAAPTGEMLKAAMDNIDAYLEKQAAIARITTFFDDKTKSKKGGY